MSEEDDFSEFEDESEVAKTFAAAAKFLQGIVSTLDQGTLLELYGLYKQSTIGPCNVPKPGLFALQAKAKWNAWNDLKAMDTETAMQRYVDKMEAVSPGWNEKAADGSIKKAAAWVSVSTMAADASDQIDPSAKTCFDFVKESNFAGLEQSISVGVQLDAIDGDGLAMLHWAADRGAVDVVRLLLKSGADVNVLDQDGQTALHYASSCGHADCVRVLLDGGADSGRRDVDGQSCADVATDESIRSMLL